MRFTKCIDDLYCMELSKVRGFKCSEPGKPSDIDGGTESGGDTESTNYHAMPWYPLNFLSFQYCEVYKMQSQKS
jgi:hypothetical protein